MSILCQICEKDIKGADRPEKIKLGELETAQGKKMELFAHEQCVRRAGEKNSLWLYTEDSRLLKDYQPPRRPTPSEEI